METLSEKSKSLTDSEDPNYQPESVSESEMNLELESEAEPDDANLGQGKSCKDYPHKKLKKMEGKKMKSDFSKSLKDLPSRVNNDLFDFQTNEDVGRANLPEEIGKKQSFSCFVSIDILIWMSCQGLNQNNDMGVGQNNLIGV